MILHNGDMGNGAEFVRDDAGYSGLCSDFLVQHHHKGHGEDGEEGGHAEQLGGIGGIFLEIQALHGAHGGGGCSGGGEDGHFHHAVKGQAEEEEDHRKGDDEELERADIEHTGLSEDGWEVGLCDGSTCNEHGEGGIQLPDHTEGFGKQGGNGDLCKEQHHAGCNGDDGRRTEHFEDGFHAVLTGDLHDTVRPCKKVEDGDKGGQVEHALQPEHCLYQRNAHEAAVGVDAGEAFDRRFPALLAADGKVGNEHGDGIGEDGEQERPAEIDRQLRPQLTLVGKEDDDGVDNGQDKTGNFADGFLGQQPEPETACTDQNEDEHDECLLENDLGHGGPPEK